MQLKIKAMELPEKIEDLTQEQKEKLAEIGFYYIKTMLKELEIENVMQEMSMEQTCNLEKWMKQTSIN